MFARDKPYQSKARLRLAPGIDLQPILILPRSLCGVEVYAMLRQVGRTFDGIILEQS